MAAEEVDIETVPGRSRAFAEFLRRHPGADPGGQLASYVEGVGKTGSAVLEAAAYQKVREAIRPRHDAMVIAWNAFESTLRKAEIQARKRHTRLGWEWDDGKLAFDWVEGVRAARLAQNLSSAIESARRVDDAMGKAHLRAAAIVHARELLRVVSDAYMPAKKPNEYQNEPAYNERTRSHLFAGCEVIPQFFNLEWVQGKPEISMRVLRDALSHGDAVVTPQGIEVHRKVQKDVQTVSYQDVDMLLALALVAYDVAAMDAVRVIANARGYIERHVEPLLRPWGPEHPEK